MKRLAVIALAALVVLPACRKKAAAPDDLLNAQNKVAVRNVDLFFESAELALVPEKRSIALPENPAAALPAIVRELAKGPATPVSLRLLPEDLVVRGAYLLPGGTAIIDLGGPTLTDGWGTGSHQEIMALYSVVHTVTANVPEAKRVRFLVNGSPGETLAGHVALDRSLLPKPALLIAPPPLTPRTPAVATPPAPAAAPVAPAPAPHPAR